MPLPDTYDKLCALHPGGYCITLTSGIVYKYGSIKTDEQYQKILNTCQAYLSAYTQVWQRTTPFTGTGPYKLYEYCDESTWFHVQPRDIVVYKPVVVPPFTETVVVASSAEPAVVPPSTETVVVPSSVKINFQFPGWFSDKKCATPGCSCGGLY